MQQFTTFFLHHWELFLALGVILAMLLGDPLLQKARGYQAVDPSEATILHNRQDALILDVREDSEYKDGHILGSVHIPLGQLTSRIKELDKHRSRPIIAACRSGSRSGHVCALLRKQGFEQIYNLRGGLMAWQNANLPITRKK